MEPHLESSNWVSGSGSETVTFGNPGGEYLHEAAMCRAGRS